MKKIKVLIAMLITALVLPLTVNHTMRNSFADETSHTIGGIIVTKDNMPLTDVLTFKITEEGGSTQNITSVEGVLYGINVTLGKKYTITLDNDKYEMDETKIVAKDNEGIPMLFIDGTDSEPFFQVVVKAKKSSNEKEVNIHDLPIVNFVDEMPSFEIGKELTFNITDKKDDSVKVIKSVKGEEFYSLPLSTLKFKVDGKYELSLQDEEFKMDSVLFTIKEKSGVYLPTDMNGKEIGTVDITAKKPQDNDTEEVFDKVVIKVLKNGTPLANSEFRLFIFDKPTYNVLLTARTNENGMYEFTNLQPNKKYQIAMENSSVKFDVERVNFETDANGKVAKSKSNLVFNAIDKNDNTFKTFPVEFKVVDKDTGNIVEGVELTASTISGGKLGSYKNFISDSKGIVNLLLEGQVGGKNYVITVSKNHMFKWDFEPESVTISIDENGNVSVFDNVEKLFKVTKNNKEHILTDFKNKVKEAEDYLNNHKFSDENAVEKYKGVLKAAKEELAKPETTPYYANGFIKDLNNAMAELKKFEIAEKPKADARTNIVIPSNNSDLNIQNSWKKSDNKWYYINKDGNTSKSQWIFDMGYWFYANKDGRISEDEWILVNGKWYFAKKGGYITTKQWHLINGKWYYFNTNGELSVNTVTPDGYRVNANGEWIK